MKLAILLGFTGVMLCAQWKPVDEPAPAPATQEAAPVQILHFKTVDDVIDSSVLQLTPADLALLQQAKTPLQAAQLLQSIYTTTANETEMRFIRGGKGYSSNAFVAHDELQHDIALAKAVRAALVPLDATIKAMREAPAPKPAKKARRKQPQHS